MSDPFEDFVPGLSSPPNRAYAITPSDSADLPLFTRALNVTASGTVKITTVSGDEATLSVVAGIAFPIRARRIWATGTSATGIVGLT